MRPAVAPWPIPAAGLRELTAACLGPLAARVLDFNRVRIPTAAGARARPRSQRFYLRIVVVPNLRAAWLSWPEQYALSRNKPLERLPDGTRAGGGWRWAAGFAFGSPPPRGRWADGFCFSWSPEPL